MFLILQEALEQKKLIVHETRDINKLAIENLSLEEIYLQAGDIVRGELQDRVFAYDVIVPAQSGKIPVGAFCVEEGWWCSASISFSAPYQIKKIILTLRCICSTWSRGSASHFDKALFS